MQTKDNIIINLDNSSKHYFGILTIREDMNKGTYTNATLTYMQTDPYGFVEVIPSEDFELEAIQEITNDILDIAREKCWELKVELKRY